MENTQESSWKNNPVLVQAIENKTAQSSAPKEDIMAEKVETLDTPKSEPAKAEAPKEQPKQEEAPKEEKNPFEVGQVWMNKVIDKKMEVLKVEPETDTLEFGIVYDKSKDYAYYSLELGIEKVKIKDWVLVEEEQEAPKEEPKPQAPPPQDNPMPEDEPETEEEIREAIQGLNILAKMGDNDVKIEIKRLKAKLKKK